jgi:hypothetical protein
VSGVPVRISGELPGAITGLAGLVITLSSPKAFPPGQPLEFTLNDSSLRLQARSIGSKRSASGEFELRVRLINLRKEAREALEAEWESFTAKTPRNAKDH